jgi:hypothetical protein
MSRTVKPALLNDTAVRIGTVFFLVVISPYLIPSVSEETLVAYGRLYIELPLLVMAIVAMQYRLQQVEDLIERRFWNLWSLGLVARFAQGSLLLASQSESVGSVTIDIALDSLFFLFYLFLALGLESQPHRSGEHVTNSQRWFDWLGVCTFFLGILLYFVIVPRVIEPDSYLRSSWLFYVLFDFYLLARLAGFVLIVRDRRWRRIYAWLLVAVVIWLFYDTVGLLTFQETVQFGIRTSTVPISVATFLAILIAARS